MSKRREQKIPKHVAGVAQITGAVGPAIQCDGKTWRLGFNTNNAKGALEELVRAHVLREAKRDGPDEYQDTKDKAYAGYYLTFERGWLSIVNSPAGTVLFLQSLLLKHHPDATAGDATRLLVAAPDETQAAIAQVSPDFFRSVAREWAAGKRMDPAAAGVAGDEVAAAVAAGFATTPPTAAPATASG